MSSPQEKLAGVYVPMCTPFDNEEIMWDGLAENVKKLNDTGLRGYFVLGTNGEYKSLGTEERYQVLDTVVKHAAKDKVIMAGCGAESTKETLHLLQRCVDSGAEMVSLLMPHFFAKKIDEAAMIDYILEVADASAVPVLVYNNPSVAAGVTVTPAVINGVKEHPNVVGIKDSSKETWRANTEACGSHMSSMSGSAGYFLDLLKAGGVGGVLSLANIIPQACADLYDAYADKRYDEAEARSRRLVALNKGVSGSYGVAGVKTAMDIMGFAGGVPRRPLRPITGEQRQDIETKLKSFLDEQ